MGFSAFEVRYRLDGVVSTIDAMYNTDTCQKENSMLRKMTLFVGTLMLVACTDGSDSDSHDDSGHCHASGAEMSPATLPDGTVGESYSQQLVAFGGEEVFSLDAGALPDGIELSEAGLLEGTPSQAGSYDFGVTSVVDDSGAECPVHPSFGDYTITVVEAQ